MNVVKMDPSLSRMVLVGMLTSRSFLSCLVPRWQDYGLFASKWENTLAQWAVEHFRRYDRAPKAEIQGYFAEWCENNKDEDARRAMESVLVNLQHEYRQLKEKLKPDHLLDIAAKLFNKNLVQKLADRLTSYSLNNEIDKAKEAINSYRGIEMGGESGFSVFSADADFEMALTQTTEPIIRYDDGLGNFFGESMYRGAFIGFMGRAKIGKSRVLQDLAWKAIHQGLNVAYFECGDSTKYELIRRYIKRMCGRPIRALTPTGLPVRYEVPTDMTVNDNNELPELVTERRRHDDDISVEQEREARHQYGTKFGWNRYKVSCHPANSISAKGVEAILEQWGVDGWRPDVIVVDYADILSPITAKYDKRDQINETWIALRAMSQRWSTLVVTATQTDAASANEWILNRSHFSENVRKYDHVTGMVGINQTDREKENGLYRLNWVIPYREMDMAESRHIWCAGCLAIEQPFMLSSF